MPVTKLILPSASFDTESALASFALCKQYFPKEKPRPYQAEIIGVLRDALTSPRFRYIFLQLPVGDGKSVIATTLAEYLVHEMKQSYYLLSPDLGLTAQYLRDFPFLREVKGRRNFFCAHHKFRNRTCDRAPCVTNPRFHCEASKICPYLIQRSRASGFPSVVSTPAYIDHAVGGEAFTTRSLSIRDEAHKLESFYLSFHSTSITQSDYEDLFPGISYPLYDDPTFWKNEIDHIYSTLFTKLELAYEQQDHRTMERFYDLNEKVKSLQFLLREAKNVVVDVAQARHSGKYYTQFRPIKASAIAKPILDKVSEKTLFMSGTFLSINDRLDELGIPPNEVLYINKTVTSFPPENRSIIYLPQGSMSFKRREKTLPKIIDTCLRIIQSHKDQRGVIICGSHQIRSTIYNALTHLHNPDLLITHKSDDFSEAIDSFLSHQTLPQVFITTRFEGLDFHDRIAEFLIYVNLPYPPPMDKQIHSRLLLEQNTHLENVHSSCNPSIDEFGSCQKAVYCHNCRHWYDLQVATAIQQSFGRIIRTPTDIGTIYILDNRFKKFFGENEDMFLSYNRSSIKL